MIEEPLDGMPDPTPGEALLRLDGSLDSLRAAGAFDDDGGSVAEGVLLDLARAVDAARSAMYAGKRSPLEFARIVTLYSEAVEQYRPRRAVSDDLDALIANISGPPIQH
jgi:hypothetical protein